MYINNCIHWCDKPFTNEDAHRGSHPHHVFSWYQPRIEQALVGDIRGHSLSLLRVPFGGSLWHNLVQHGRIKYIHIQAIDVYIDVRYPDKSQLVARDQQPP